jgi:hypothetical protein
MIPLSHDAALLVTTAGLTAAALALAATRQIRWSIAILLDFFTAAGLLRLVGRQVASLGLRFTQAPPT